MKTIDAKTNGSKAIIGTWTAIVAACACLLPTPAVAAGATGTNIGGHVGYAQAEGAESGNWLVGGHLELMPTSFLGIQGSVDYRSVETVRVNVFDTQGNFQVRSVPVTVEGRLYIPGDTIAPFAAVGGGWYFLNYDYSENLEALGLEDDWDNKFGWHIGAGAALSLSPRVSLFGEARAVFLDPQRELDDETLEEVTDFEYDSTYFAAGLNFKL